MLKVFEAFAGYGSQRMALKNLNIKHEVVAISEIDKFAIASYEAIHGETNNLGDISKIQATDIPDHDLFTYSFPCQDISVAGKGEGFSKDSGTRSGLLWECQRVIDTKKPKYLLMENVKNLISDKFMPGFIEWIMYLESLGYSNYYEVLNAKDFGIPQNRERVFMVSILGGHEPYAFPKPVKLEKRLKDVLENQVDEKYYLDDERTKQLIVNLKGKNEVGYVPYKQGGKQHQSNTVYDMDKTSPALEARDYKGAKQILEVNRIGGIFDSKTKTHQSGAIFDKEQLAPTLDTMQGGWRQPSIVEGIPIKNNTEKGYLVAKDGDGVDLAYPTSNSRRGRVQKEMAQTLTTDDSKGVVETRIIQKPRGYNKGGQHEISPSITSSSWQENNLLKNSYRIRKLTPLECFRLMDVSDKDFYKAQEVNSNSQLYKQAGNSIVVSVLEAIFRNMFLGVPEEDLIGENIPLF